MIYLITFCLGLAIGIGIYYWQTNRFNRSLQQIINLTSGHKDTKISLSLVYRVRREIVQLQELLAEQEEQLASWQGLFNYIPLGYLHLDQDNQVLWCNQKAQEMLKITNPRLDNPRLLLELVRCYELDQLIELTRQSQVNQMEIWEFYTGDAKDNIESVSLKGYSFPLLGGEVGVFIENIQLITREKRRTEQVISDLSHELRTPLTSIALVTETLAKRLANPEKRWIEQMHQQTLRLIELVQEWLEISQIQQNPTQYLHYQTVIIDELIATSWLIVEPLAKQKNLVLDYQGVRNLSLEGDRSRLTQVLVNLFDNSIKHSPNGNKIQIIVNLLSDNRPQSYIEINVIDSGSGFVLEDLPHVFERLYRGDHSRFRPSSTQGSGLGLSIVKEIILAHTGEITANNHPKTHGAWLQFTLPQLK
jgi:two-component system phosphate regulon sensor histidine kinase PhoR